ncbi:hypothetical protein GCM10027589_37930 [Actinocorallia lasiicapitis]
MGNEAANKELVNSFFERVWNKGDFGYMDEVYTEDFQLNALWQNTSLGRSGQASKEEARTTIQGWLAGFPDMHVTVEEQLGEGAFVASRHIAAGTHTAEFKNLPITGRFGAVSGITVNRIEGDRIAEVWTCWDAVGMMQQLGIFPTPEGAVPRPEHDAAWAASQAMPDGAGDPEDAKATVQRFYRELWTEGKLAVADELFHPDFVGHAPGGNLTRGPEGVKKLVSEWRVGVPDMELEIHAQVAEGGRVATRFTGRGTHLGTWLGFPPTGLKISLSGIAITRVIDGQVVSDWGEFDIMGLLQQFGVIPKPE